MQLGVIECVQSGRNNGLRLWMHFYHWFFIIINFIDPCVASVQFVNWPCKRNHTIYGSLVCRNVSFVIIINITDPFVALFLFVIDRTKGILPFVSHLHAGLSALTTLSYARCRNHLYKLSCRINQVTKLLKCIFESPNWLKGFIQNSKNARQTSDIDVAYHVAPCLQTYASSQIK